MLSVVTFASGTPPANNEISGLAGFWVLGTVLALIPFAPRLEITETNVSSYFLRFCVTNLHASYVLVLEYGTLMRGGLGVGKGLKIWAMSNGRRKYYSIGEKLYGKEAIAHAKRVLESQLHQNEISVPGRRKARATPIAEHQVRSVCNV